MFHEQVYEEQYPEYQCSAILMSFLHQPQPILPPPVQVTLGPLLVIVLRDTGPLVTQNPYPLLF